MDSSRRFDFETLPPSMLRMIRSARSRLHRESGFEDRESSRTSEVKSGSIHRLTRSRVSLVPSVDSENAAPEKAQADVAPASVLGDATNTYCTGQRPPSAPLPTSAKLNIASLRPREPQITSVPASEMDEMLVQSGNAQHAAEYVPDIVNVLKSEELLHLPSPSYMDMQVQVNVKMRAILIDWLVDVHKKYKLRPETLFLAVQLIDRYLAVRVTAQNQLQLVGATALMIAAKFEEIHPPRMKEFVYVTDKAYSQEDIQRMEVCILKALQFKVCCPTAMHFLERIQNVNGCTDAHRDLAQYILELALVDYKMLKYAPSHLAAASVLLSNKLLRRLAWTPAAAQQSNMTESMLMECAKEMCAIVESAESSTMQAVRRKFSQSKHHCVAKLNFALSPSTTQVGAGSVGCVARRSIGGTM